MSFRRAVKRQSDENSNPGAILPLEVAQSSVYNVAYTIPIIVGASQQNLSLQVDTGSSDLWIASTSCSTSDCRASTRLYNPSQATNTGQSFDIQYLQGLVSGPIVWDQVSLGGYTISNQALAAADSVRSEPLSRSFNGVLGLALPLNSVIASVIPPVIGNAPDGAAFASNLFGITPASSAPPARFLSLSLSRPGSDRIPALFCIGRHPPQLVSDPTQIRYAPLVSERSGILFWKATVRAITVYVDGQPKPINIGRPASGGVFPTATLDTGVPLILTTSAIANGIYGAIGVSPARDGQYYVPCTTPLNMTITLDNRPEIPLHPLDLTGEPPVGSSASTYCIGLIQSADVHLTRPDSDTGDIIFGVPFLRNTYTVMAYDPPDPSTGLFASNRSATVGINPRLGLLPLTDPSVALAEFNRVRVYNQPLNPSASPVPRPSAGGGGAGRRRGVGISVLIGLVSFVGLCFVLFAGRWVVGRFGRGRRRGRRVAAAVTTTAASDAADGGEGGKGKGISWPGSDGRQRVRDGSYVRKERLASEYTATDSARTRVDSGVVEDDDDDDSGVFAKKPDAGSSLDAGDDPWEETIRSLYAQSRSRSRDESESARDVEDGFGRPMTAASTTTLTAAAATATTTTTATSTTTKPHSPHHQQTQSVSWPLLVHAHNNSLGEEDLTEFGLGLGPRESMAGIGTAARGSRIGAPPSVRSGGGGGSVSSLSGMFPAASAASREASPSRSQDRGRYPSIVRLSANRDVDLGLS